MRSNPILSARKLKGPLAGPDLFVLPTVVADVERVRRAPQRRYNPGREAAIPPYPPEIEAGPFMGPLVFRLHSSTSWRAIVADPGVISFSGIPFH